MYTKFQLRKFARCYLQKNDIEWAAMEAGIPVNEAGTLLTNADFIEQLTHVAQKNDIIQHHKDMIVDWIGNGQTLRDYCRQPDTPSFKTVYNWLEEDESFATRFAHARDIGYDAIAMECLQIADTPINEIIDTKTEKGYSITKRDAIKHRNLQIDTRLKLLAKWNPKKYGTVMRTELSGRDGAPIETVDKTPVNEKDLARRLAFMLQKGAKQNESAGRDNSED